MSFIPTAISASVHSFGRHSPTLKPLPNGLAAEAGPV